MTTRNDGHSEEQPTVVIRDRRRIDPETGAPRQVAVANVGGVTAEAAKASAAAAAAEPSPSNVPGEGTTSPGTAADTTAGAGGPGGPAGTGDAAAAAGPETGLGGGADETKLAIELAERTADLQRITAEYANYRRRVERDRQLAGEQATGAVLTALLPVLDDLDRARAHGDLTGAFGAVAEQLTAILTKLGLSAFGEVGDPFDPTFHEAVAHTTSPEVTETACVEVLRRGYALGDRLLRAAMVVVADPADPGGPDGSAGPAGPDGGTADRADSGAGQSSGDLAAG